MMRYFLPLLIALLGLPGAAPAFAQEAIPTGQTQAIPDNNAVPETRIAMLEQQLQAVRAELTQANAALQERDAAIQRLERELSQTRRALTEARGTAQRSSASTSALEADNAALRTQIDELTGQIAAAQSERDTAQRNLQQLEAVLADLRLTADAQRSSFNASRQQLVLAGIGLAVLVLIAFAVGVAWHRRAIRRQLGGWDL